jgi:hypothetical protein
MHELRLSHKRVLRQKGREAAALQDELTNARAQLRELRIQKRDLQAVCPSCCLLLIVDRAKRVPMTSGKHMAGYMCSNFTICTSKSRVLFVHCVQFQIGSSTHACTGLVTLDKQKVKTCRAARHPYQSYCFWKVTRKSVTRAPQQFHDHGKSKLKLP